MPENLLIAIIGLAGAVLAAMIGAFGAIAAAEIKGKGKAEEKSTGSCGMIGLAASLAGAIGLVLGLLFATSLVQGLGSATSRPTAAVQVQPTSVVVITTTAPQPVVQPAGLEPLRSHVVTSIGTGLFAKATFSDGQAPYDENWLWANNHFNIQRIRREENPDGCGIAEYQVDKIWIGVASIAKVTVNGSEIGTITNITPHQKHGYIVDVSLNLGDKICVSPIPAAGFHTVFGPDIYYHYDSYCYRGNC